MMHVNDVGVVSTGMFGPEDVVFPEGSRPTVVEAGHAIVAHSMLEQLVCSSHFQASSFCVAQLENSLQRIFESLHWPLRWSGTACLKATIEYCLW